MNTNSVLYQEILNQAKEALEQGKIIIIPTETVYGIAADATNKFAIEKIFQIKQRDSKKPLQILTKDINSAKKFVRFNEKSTELAKEYWPGPLTLILDEISGGRISENIRTSDGTLGVRVPDHKVLDDLFKILDFPIAATSANISGEGAIDNFSDAKAKFESKVSVIIDGGECNLGTASSVIDARDEANIKILREGVVKV